MKLNRKGYLTIEIILAAVLTFVIAFFLVDITMKLSSNTDDAYSDTVLVTDKTLITKNIKENLKKDICAYDIIDNVICLDDYTCEIYFKQSGGPREARKISIEGSKVKYMDLDNQLLYEKNIDKSLSNIKLTSSNSNGYYNFKISGTNIFVDENYDMNIFVYNGCY